MLYLNNNNNTNSPSLGVMPALARVYVSSFWDFRIWSPYLMGSNQAAGVFNCVSLSFSLFPFHFIIKYLLYAEETDLLNKYLCL